MSLLKWKELAKQKSELGNKINLVHNTITKKKLGEETRQIGYEKMFKPITSKLDDVNVSNLVPIQKNKVTKSKKKMKDKTDIDYYPEVDPYEEMDIEALIDDFGDEVPPQEEKQIALDIYPKLPTILEEDEEQDLPGYTTSEEQDLPGYTTSEEQDLPGYTTAEEQFYGDEPSVTTTVTEEDITTATEDDDEKDEENIDLSIYKNKEDFLETKKVFKKYNLKLPEKNKGKEENIIISLNNTIKKIGDEKTKNTKYLKKIFIENDPEEGAILYDEYKNMKKIKDENELDKIRKKLVKNIKKKYSSDVIDQIKENIKERDSLDNDSNIINKRRHILSVEGKGLKIKKGGNVTFYNDPKELLKKLELIVGSIIAGNTNIEMYNIGIAILDILLKTKVINKSQHEKIYKNYFK